MQVKISLDEYNLDQWYPLEDKLNEELVQEAKNFVYESITKNEAVDASTGIPGAIGYGNDIQKEISDFVANFFLTPEKIQEFLNKAQQMAQSAGLQLDEFDLESLRDGYEHHVWDGANQAFNVLQSEGMEKKMHPREENRDENGRLKWTSVHQVLAWPNNSLSGGSSDIADEDEAMDGQNMGREKTFPLQPNEKLQPDKNNPDFQRAPAGTGSGKSSHVELKYGN